MSAAPKVDKESPNQMIDDAIKLLMRKIDNGKEPTDTCVKIVNTAISWEKIKNGINGPDNPFDEDAL